MLKNQIILIFISLIIFLFFGFLPGSEILPNWFLFFLGIVIIAMIWGIYLLFGFHLTPEQRKKRNEEIKMEENLRNEARKKELELRNEAYHRRKGEIQAEEEAGLYDEDDDEEEHYQKKKPSPRDSFRALGGNPNRFFKK
ncbi:MAG: hypothetical protein AABX51_00600 [Nanoarchaeota archaeon]